MMAAGGRESSGQPEREVADWTLGLTGPATTAAAAHHAPPNAGRTKPNLERIMTKSYIIAKTIFASLTVLVAEAAFLGVNNGSVDWRLIAVSAALAWGVIQIVEFFLLRDAIENSVAKGVVDWIKQNLETGEEAVAAPSNAGSGDIAKLAISPAAEAAE
jgi:hypothetical protein